MTTYYRVTDGAVRDLDDAQFAAMQANGKAANLRLYVVDVQPVPSSTQVVINAGVVVGSVEAHQTWAMRAKTQAELDNDALTVERTALLAMVQNLTEDIALGVTPAPTTAAQAFVHIQELKRQMLRMNRVARWLLKQQG